MLQLQLCRVLQVYSKSNESPINQCPPSTNPEKFDCYWIKTGSTYCSSVRPLTKLLIGNLLPTRIRATISAAAKSEYFSAHRDAMASFPSSLRTWDWNGEPTHQLAPKSCNSPIFLKANQKPGKCFTPKWVSSLQPHSFSPVPRFRRHLFQGVSFQGRELNSQRAHKLHGKVRLLELPIFCPVFLLVFLEKKTTQKVKKMSTN